MLPVFQSIGNVAVGIIKITKIHTFCRTNGNAGWLFALGDPMVTKSTFINIAIRVRIPCFVRAGFDAGTTADTFIVSYQHNTAFNNMTRASRAASNTGRIVAMVATLRTKFDFNIWITSVNRFSYPIAAVADGDIVFSLAGDDTIAASHAFSSIYCHSVSHDLISFRGFSVKNVTKLPLMPVPPIIGSICTVVIISESLAPLP